MKKEKKIYERLITEVIKEEIQIRLKPYDGQFSQYVRRKGLSGPEILWVRKDVKKYDEGKVISLDDAQIVKALTVTDFINSAEDLEWELIIMAHEFGHHFSKYKDYESVHDRYGCDRTSVTLRERENNYNEEVFAWDFAYCKLTGLDYKHFRKFHGLRRRRLKTYWKGYRLEEASGILRRY